MISGKVKGMSDLMRKFKALEQAAQDEIMTKAAFAGASVIEGHAKINIQADDLIDTGFMLNSVYTSSVGESAYEAAKSAAYEAWDRSTSKTKGEERPGFHRQYRHSKPGRAAVAVGAEYAIFQHDGTSRTAAHPFMAQAASNGAQDGFDAAATVFRDQVDKAVR